jgi:hypothetical protein
MIKKAPELKKPEQPKQEDETGDFKNSLAALLSRGKPGAKVQKKPEPEEEKKQAPKKMSIFDEDDEDDHFNAPVQRRTNKTVV